MTKILVNPINLKHIEYLNNKDIAGYIIGLKNYSIFQNLKLDIDTIKKLNTKKEIYISINKPIHNNEIQLLIFLLLFLSRLILMWMVHFFPYLKSYPSSG